MAKSRKIMMAILLAATLFAAAIGFALLNFSRAEAVTVNGERTVTDFSVVDWEIKNNKDRVTSSLEIRFLGVTESKQSAAVFNTRLTGAWSVDFYQEVPLGTLGAAPHLYVALGADEASGTAGATVLNFNNTGVIDAAAPDSYVLNVRGDPNMGWFNHRLYYRIAVNAEGNLEFYCDQSPLAEGAEPRSTITLDNADFSLTDGYFSFLNGQIGPEWVEDYGDAMDIVVKSLAVKCEAAQVDTSVMTFSQENAAAWAVTGDQSKVDFGMAEFNTTDDNTYIQRDPVICDNPIMKSRFKISDENVAEGEEIFTLSYNISRSYNTTHEHLRWGVYFGLDENAEYVTMSDPSVTHGRVGMYAGDQSCGSDVFINQGHTIHVTVTGYKGGRVVAAYDCPEHSADGPCTHPDGWTVETNFGDGAFNGYFAFGISGDTISGATLRVWDVQFSGHCETDVTVSSVTIDETAFADLLEGETARLSASVVTSPRAAAFGGVDWSVVSGSEYASVEGDVLTCSASGSVTVRAASKIDSSVYDEYTFEIGSYQDVFTLTNEAYLGSLVVGDTLAVSASYTTYPDIGSGEAETAISVTAGKGTVVTLSEGTLTAVGKGEFTLRVTEQQNNHYKDYSGRVFENKYECKIENETFADGIDEDVFGLVVPGSGSIVSRENIFQKDGINFSGTETVGGVNPKAVLRGVPFAPTAGSDVVFDITFTASLNRASDYAVGLLFGMPDENANRGESGVGAVEVKSTSVYVYNGTQKMAPTFVAEGDSYSYGKEESSAFIQDAPVTLRLVGKTNGTLDLYRGQQHSELGINTDITKLYATYSGFDFSGYAAFYAAGSTAMESGTATGYVTGVSASGSFAYDSDAVVRDIVLDSDLSGLRYAAGAEPIELDVTVYTAPVTAASEGWKAEIVSGSEFAEIDGQNRLVLKGAGEVQLKISSAADPDVYTEVTFTVLEPLGTITFDESVLLGLVVGDKVELEAVYGTNPPTEVDDAVTFAITEGADVASIENGVLTAKTAGEATLTITSVAMPSVTREIKFTVSDAKTYDFNLENETFADGIDEDMFRIVLPGAGSIVNRENIFQKDGINFSGTETVGEVNPKAVLKGMPFGAVAAKDAVFDITFTASVAPAGMHPFGVGLLFGMPGEFSNFAESGAVEVTSTAVYVYYKGSRVTPVFVAKGDPLSYGKEESSAFTSMAPVTLRLVARKDGTLEVYRGQQYTDPTEGFTINTDITELYATYSGFDFGGYTAFYSRGAHSGCTGHIENVTIKGSFLYTDADIVRDIVLNTSLEGLRYVAGLDPVELDVAVITVPNMADKQGWKAEIVSGPAQIDAENRLVLTGVGEVTLKITSLADGDVYIEKTFTVSAPVGSIAFDGSLLANLIIGDEVTLQAAYVTDPPSEVDDGVTYTIVAGTDVVQIEGGILKALKAGSAKLRITSNEDSEVFAEYDITVSDLERYDYRLNEDFSSLVEETWKISSTGSGSIQTSLGLIFNGTLNSEGANPKAVLQLPLSADPATGIVFDITFTARPGSRTVTPFGLMFAMPSQDSNVNDAGVGSIQFTNTWAHVYMAGQRLTPNYVTTGTGNEWYGKDDGFAFMCDNPMTVRLVGRADGTLELYMNMHYGDYGVDIDKLFATYSGFDFNGYIAFFSNVNEGSYSATIQNVSLQATTLYDPKQCEVTRIVLDDSGFVDLLYDGQPIDLDISVYAKPNFDIFTGYKVEVVSGPASINENEQLVLTGPGTVKIRITSTWDETRTLEKEITVGELIITKINIVTTAFENVTTDSQPIDLVATMESNTYLERYLGVEFTVLEGNAEIVGKQLRITGAGKVVIQAKAVSQPSVTATYEFTVADADAQYGSSEGGGCQKNSSYTTLAAFLPLLAAGLVVGFKKH